MIRVILAGLLLWSIVATTTVGIWGWERGAFAAEEKLVTNETKNPKSFRGRLPPYYAKVVTQQQREKIYMIQAEYRPKIEAARAQLEALINEEKARILAVLTEQQRKKIEEAQAAAKAKRAEQKAAVQEGANTPPAEIP